MANWHVQRLQSMKGISVIACCDIVEAQVKAFAEKYHIPHIYTDFRKMITTEKLDGVTNVTPDAFHEKVSIACLKKNIPVLSEKPMASSLIEAKRMLAAARKTRTPNMVNFSYRASCGLQAAQRLIKNGTLGNLRHVEASYLQGWLSGMDFKGLAKRPGAAWRLSTKHGSMGVLGDLGCHIYDMVSFLCGDIAEIDCRMKTFNKLPGNRVGAYVLDANDSFISTVAFKNGAIGTIHSSRWATGYSNSIHIRVSGDKGSIVIDLDKSYDEYRIFLRGKPLKDGKPGWETVVCKKTPDNFERFIKGIRTRKNDVSDFVNGLKIQTYLHYSMASNKAKKPLKIHF
jgi:predicted dehydrogenase